MEHNPIGEESGASMPHSPAQLLLFLSALIFLCMLLGSGIIALCTSVQGIDFQEAVDGFGKESTLQDRHFMRGALLVNHLLSFLLPAMLTGYVFFKTKWASEMGLRRAPDFELFGLGVLLVVASFPLAQTAFSANRWVVENISWLQSLVVSESATEQLMEGLLVMASPLELLFSLLVMAVVPAIGEEMVFRGILQKQLQRIMANPYLAILATALVFSLAHFQVQRFLAIFLLGVVLGLVFHWTKNLWIPIAGHFVFNGTQVFAAYFLQDDLEKLNAGDEMEMPLALTLTALALVFLISRRMIKSIKLNF